MTPDIPAPGPANDGPSDEPSTAAAMAQGRRADSARRRQRVLTALTEATNAGDPISVSAIARRAGVDRSFLYRHRDLLEQIHALEADLGVRDVVEDDRVRALALQLRLCPLEALAGLGGEADDRLTLPATSRERGQDVLHRLDAGRQANQSV